MGVNEEDKGPDGGGVMGGKAEERRRFLRIESEILTKYILVTERDFNRRISDALTKDISVRGVRIEAEEELPPGTRLVLELNLPGVDHPVTPPGRVVWCRRKGERYEAGVELIWLSFQGEDQKALADYINSKLEGELT